MTQASDNPKRITLRDVANAAGVSHSTVSRALQGSPLVKSATRERLLKLADEMGYRPDPMLSALTAYRSRIHLSKQRDAIAFVVGDFLLEPWADIIENARKRADKLGFEMQQHIWQPELSANRQSDILRARGIKGIIIGPVNRLNDRIPLPILPNYFSMVAVGRFISNPKVNTVTPNHFDSITQACDALRDKGYRRIGLAMIRRQHQRVGGRFIAAYLAYQQNLPPEERVSLCIPDHEDQARDQFLPWIDSERPDALLAYFHNYEQFRSWGLPIPEKIAFAALNLNQAFAGKISGTDVNDPAVGKALVDMLHSQLLTGETGIPEHPRTLVVDTFWRDGPSAPQR